MGRIFDFTSDINYCMDEKSILVKPIRKTRDSRAIVLKFRFNNDLSEFLKLLEENIENFKQKYYHKYYLGKNTFFKKIGKQLEDIDTDNLFKLDLIIVAYKNNKIEEVVDYMDNNSSIIKSTEKLLFKKFFNKDRGS